MKITLHCVQAGANSQAIGSSSNLLIARLPQKSDAVDDANADAFPDQTKKNVNFECTGLSDAVMAEFKAGARLTVTVEVAK